VRDDQALQAAVMVPVGECIMHLPAHIGDYTDFYSSKEHATNIGKMFRPTEAPLKPNWSVPIIAVLTPCYYLRWLCCAVLCCAVLCCAVLSSS
jgi:2-keto-4-pentenoate hydratase/2-oxohepta-3-ene-1,7-dioic acid hydratase in catechol pathway